MFRLLNYCSVWTVIDPGDEVVLFDPSYETYEGCIRMAGGIPVSFFLRKKLVLNCIIMVKEFWIIENYSQVYVALEPPHWTLDPDRFINSFTARTKAVILNRLEIPIKGTILPFYF
jgi:aspartate/methionine/tyrosine aminotransferase